MLSSAPIRRRRKLSLTPLIDVIFLLLLFFMLSSTFSRFAEVSIDGGGTGSGGSQPDAILTLNGSILQFNGTATPITDIEDRIVSLKEKGGKAVMLIVGNESVSQDLVPVLQALNKTGIGIVVARLGQ